MGLTYFPYIYPLDILVFFRQQWCDVWTTIFFLVCQQNGAREKIKYKATGKLPSVLNIIHQTLQGKPTAQNKTNRMSMIGNGKRRACLKRLRKESLRLKFLLTSRSSAFNWNRFTLPDSFMDDVVFQILSVIEAIVLVISLCFLYFRCGRSLWM